MQAGGGIFDNPNASLTMSNYITGPGSLTTLGTTFILTLTDTSNSYTGGTIVQSGTLKANVAAVHAWIDFRSVVRDRRRHARILNAASHTVGAW